MLPLSYAPPHPRPNRCPSHKPKPQPFSCALPFPDALRAAAAAAAISLSFLAGNAAGAASAAAAMEQPPEICRGGDGGRDAEVKAEAVTNEQLVEEVWEVVNEGFLPDAGNRPWSPELWMVSLSCGNATKDGCIQWFNVMKSQMHILVGMLSSYTVILLRCRFNSLFYFAMSDT